MISDQRHHTGQSIARWLYVLMLAWIMAVPMVHGSRVLPLEDYFKWIQPHCYTYTNAAGDTFGYAYDANGNQM